jgi:hypothetical protein
MDKYYKKYIKYKLKYNLLKDKMLKGGYLIDINNNLLLTCLNRKNNLMCFNANTMKEQPISIRTNLCTKEKGTRNNFDYEYFEKNSKDEEFRKVTKGKEGFTTQYKNTDDRLLRDLKNNKYNIYYCNNMRIKKNDIIKIYLIEKKESYKTLSKRELHSDFFEVTTVEETNIKLENIKKLKWYNIEHIFKNSWVNYDTFRTPEEYFSKKRFMLVKEKTFLKVCQELSNDYQYNYRDHFEDSYFEEKDDNALYFNKNYRFIQKVNINNKNAKIIIIGDFHSSFHSLYEILKNTRDHFIGDTMKLNENSYIFFLGDIIDRGPYSIELLYFIFILKIINFDKIFIIAGNHEDREQYTRYGFTNELEKQFNYNYRDLQDNEIFDIQKILWYFPECIYLNLNGKRYHLSHGSIVNNLDDKLEKFLNNKRQRFMIINDRNKYINYSWGDFDNSISGAQPSRRDGYKGKLLLYGPDLVNEHMKKFKIKMCITGHQDMTPIAFLLKEKNAGIKKIDDNVFYPCREENNLCYMAGYKLHSMNKGNFFIDKKNVYVSTINPENNDLLALVTSTAVISKQLEYHCYLILDSNI